MDETSPDKLAMEQVAAGVVPDDATEQTDATDNAQSVSAPAETAVEAPQSTADAVESSADAPQSSAGVAESPVDAPQSTADASGMAAETAAPESVSMETAATPDEIPSSVPAASEGASNGAPLRPRQPSMAQIMESDEFSSYISGADALQRGALLKGVVVRVDENTGEMLVDVGTKSEGIIARNEVGDDTIAVGDDIEVVVLRPEDDDGHPILSKRRADFERRWRELATARDNQTAIEGTVREQVKGGLIVDLGVSAFVPASHVDTRNRGDLARFVGRTIAVRVIEIDRKKNKVIASHRLAAEEDRKKREEEAWGTLQKDKIVEGVVRRITEFGAFIDLGGIDGLLHVREMAWGRVEHPETVVKKGQKLQVLILDIDEERKRIALGLKQLQSDPWKKVAGKYKVGETVTGKVVRIAPSCAFVEMEEGVEAIIPISEMSETRINKPEDVLEVGQEVEARIKQLQPNQRRITLSLRAAIVERERRETRTAIREVNERATGGSGAGGGNDRGSGSGGGGGNSGGGGGNSGGGGDDGTLRLGDLFGQQLRAARERGRERNEAKAADRREARERAMEQAAAEEDDDDFEVEDTSVEVSADSEAVQDEVVENEAVQDETVESDTVEGDTVEGDTVEGDTVVDGANEAVVGDESTAENS